MPEIKITGRDIDVLGGNRVLIRNPVLSEAVPKDRVGIHALISKDLGGIDPEDIEIDSSGGVVITNPLAAKSVMAAMSKNLAAADTNYVACGANYQCKPK